MGAQLCIRWYIDPYRWHGQFKRDTVGNNYIYISNSFIVSWRHSKKMFTISDIRKLYIIYCHLVGSEQLPSFRLLLLSAGHHCLLSNLFWWNFTNGCKYEFHEWYCIAWVLWATFSCIGSINLILFSGDPKCCDTVELEKGKQQVLGESYNGTW